MGVDNALNEGQGRHAEEEVERVELEGLGGEDAGPDGTAGGGCDDRMASLEKVGDDCLEGCQDSAEEGEKEAPESEVVVAIGCKADTDDDGDEGEELGGRKGVGEEEVRDGDDKERGGGADDLVEGDGDELKRDVGDGDVDGVEKGECGEEEGFTGGQAGWGLRGISGEEGAGEHGLTK